MVDTHHTETVIVWNSGLWVNESQGEISISNSKLYSLHLWGLETRKTTDVIQKKIMIARKSIIIDQRVAWLKHVFNLNPIWRVFKRQVTEGYQHLQSSSVILISSIVIFTRFTCSQRLTLEKSYTFTPLLSLFKYFFVPGTKRRASDASSSI